MTDGMTMAQIRQLALAVIAQAFSDLQTRPKRERRKDGTVRVTDKDQRSAARFLSGDEALHDWAHVAQVPASAVIKKAWSKHGDLMARYGAARHAA